MTTSYVPSRTSEPVKPDGWQTGAAEFNDITAKIAAKGWTVEHDANMSFYGPFWVVTPFGTFEGHGFGRGDSLHIAYKAALIAETRS